MKKIILTLLFLLFIVACQPQTVEETPGACPPDCSSGSEALQTDIILPTPNGNVYANEQFAPYFYVRNLGEANSDGTILVTGLDRSVFSSYTGCYPIEFTTVVDDPDDPFFKEAIFDSLPKADVNTEANLEQIMTAYTRYTYTTFATMSSCITTNIVDEPDCSTSPTTNRLDTSSSGPLTVTTITQELSSPGSGAVTLRLRVNAKIDAQATQRVINTDLVSSSECVISTEGLDIVKAKTSLVILGREYSCGDLAFEGGKGEATTTCIVENIDTNILVGGQKEKDGYLKIDYGFQDIQSVPFNVVSSFDNVA
jgi:hypothetical protein